MLEKTKIYADVSVSPTLTDDDSERKEDDIQEKDKEDDPSATEKEDDSSVPGDSARSSGGGGGGTFLFSTEAYTAQGARFLRRPRTGPNLSLNVQNRVFKDLCQSPVSSSLILKLR